MLEHWISNNVPSISYHKKELDIKKLWTPNGCQILKKKTTTKSSHNTPTIYVAIFGFIFFSLDPHYAMNKNHLRKKKRIQFEPISLSVIINTTTWTTAAVGYIKIQVNETVECVRQQRRSIESKWKRKKKKYHDGIQIIVVLCVFADARK